MGTDKTQDKLKGETTGSQQKLQKNEIQLTIIAEKIQGKPTEQEQNVIKWNNQKNNENYKKPTLLIEESSYKVPIISF